MQRQLRLARDVQMRMLPRHAPKLPGLDVSTRYVPSLELGGDFYAVFPVGASLGKVIGDVVELIDVRVAEAWDHTERVEFPVPVPDPDRERRFIGPHDFAMAAVEVSVPQADADAWTQIIWIPFSRYLETSNDLHRDITLPDGRELTLAFGRLRHPFPGFGLRLLDFEMIAYDHRGAPRDYQSVLRVVPQAMPGDAESRSPLGEPYERVAKLNAPLRAPFVWDDARSWFGNVAITLTRGVNPNQYKLSQAGWDQQGWQETQTLADAGTLERPFARFTILQVGNNPGIHVIALGSILMAVGIPWAFYVKPWLVRREKARFASMAKAAQADKGDKAAKTDRGKTGTNTAATAGPGTPVRQAS